MPTKDLKEKKVAAKKVSVKKGIAKKPVAKKAIAKKIVKVPAEKEICKDTPEIKKLERKTSFEGRYFYAVGRRKSAVAKVKLFETFGKEEIVVNGRKMEDYFGVLRLRNVVREPLEKLGKEKQFSIEAKVVGGGISAQAEALRLGIARSLVLFDEGLRKVLKDLKLLTRDPRVVERKKAGLKKARRSPQWAKR